jgi:hypothetical protein
MARPRKRRKPAAETSADIEQAATTPAEPGLPPERRCWLCSQPLTHGVMAPLLGLGSFEVHQRCYDEALKG